MRTYFTQIKIAIRYLLIALFLFEISRIIFIIYNYDQFPEIAQKSIVPFLFYGLQYDLSSILLVNAPFLALSLLPIPIFNENKNVLKLLYGIGTGVGLLLNMLYIAYFKSNKTLISWDAFDLYPLIEHWWLLLIAAIMIFVMMRWTKQQGLADSSNGSIKHWLVYSILMFLSCIGIFNGMNRDSYSENNAHSENQVYLPVLFNGLFSLNNTHSINEMKHISDLQKDSLLN